MTGALINPEPNYERMTEIMFKAYNMPTINDAIQAVPSLYASGRTIGIVIIGNGVSHAVQDYEVHALPHTVVRLVLTGHELNKYLTKIHTEGGYAFTTNAKHEISRDIGEKLYYVAPEITTATASNFPKKFYELPVDQVNPINKEPFPWQRYNNVR